MINHARMEVGSDQHYEPSLPVDLADWLDLLDADQNTRRLQLYGGVYFVSATPKTLKKNERTDPFITRHLTGFWVTGPF